jgi:HK97 family phage prohead protease
MEYKAQIFEAKAVPDGKNLFVEGYAAVFGNEDSYNDIIVAGAFTKTIAGKEGKRIKLCLQHDMEDIVGKIVELKEDEKGLWFKAKISNTTMGKDLSILIEDDAINEISIGYQSIVWEVDEVRNVRLLKEVKLYEISFVSRAANEQATIRATEVKAGQPKPIEEMKDEELIKLKSEIEGEINIRTIKQFLKIY